MLSTTVRTELIAGTTTFASLCSILLMVPIILSSAGLDPTHTFVATALTCAISSTVTGLWAKTPVALGPGLTMATFFSTTLVGKLHLSVEEAFGMVILSALLMALIIQCHWLKGFKALVPDNVISATTVGLGLLFLRLAFMLSGSFHDQSLHLPEAGLWLGTTLLILWLRHHQIKSAILIGIAAASILGYFFLPPLDPTQSQKAFAWMLPTLPNLLDANLWYTLATMTIVVLFDNTATLHAFLTTLPKAHHPNTKQLQQTLSTTALGSLTAGLLGTTPANVFLESKAGILAGGRGRLCALTIALWCLASLALAPWMHLISHQAIASAMTIIALALLRPIYDWPSKRAYTLLSLLTNALLIPVYFSLMMGIAAGLTLHYSHKLYTRPSSFGYKEIVLYLGCLCYWALNLLG